MLSPLAKRLPRELKHNIGKYLGIFLLMFICIAAVTGFLIAGSSIERILLAVDEDYNVEDGRFTTAFEIDTNDVDAVEALGVKVYENYSIDAGMSTATSGDTDMTARIYANREQVDLAAYAEGSAPQDNTQIALDRVFCANNGIGVGDTVTVEGHDLTVSGICTLADYQALFENNSDFVFNSMTFTIAQVDQTLFDEMKRGGAPCQYTYSFTVDSSAGELDDAARVDLETDIADVLADRSITVTDFMDSAANQGIGYALDDVQGDQAIWQMLVYIIVAIMAFVFVVLTGSTIEEESAVIGTLLASGYRKRELLAHYMALPTIVGIVAALAGNVMGYFALTDMMKDLYYNSYSLPPYTSYFNPSVFVTCTVIPLVLLLGITFVGLLRKLKCTPLQFLRHETRRSRKRGGMQLPEKLGFSGRFRIRVFLRNISSFVTLFLGITFSSLLLIFGFCLMPTIDGYAESMKNDLVSEHLYSLKAPLELTGTDEEVAAWAAINELSTRVDLSDIDTDAVESDLENLLETRAENIVENTLDRNFNEDRLVELVTQAVQESMISQTPVQGSIAGIEISSLLNASSLDDVLGGKDYSDINVRELVRLGVLRSSLVDLSSCGLGTVNLATFDQNSIDSDSLDMSQIDFSGVSQEDVGLGGVDLDGMSLNEFFGLVQSASKVDSDADNVHPVNTKSNSEEAVAQAEKIAVGSLETKRAYTDAKETVSVYGIQPDSAYWTDVDAADGGIAIGNGLSEKCQISVGDTVRFDDKYGGKSYDLVITQTYGSKSNMNMCMQIDNFNEMFDNDSGYFNGYASNMPLELDARYTSNDLTPANMDKISNQMTNSMGDMMTMIMGLAVLIAFVLMYLLTKTVIDRSARAISYMKVFGYKDREIDRLYVRSITITVVASLLICIPILIELLDFVVRIAFTEYAGNIVLSLPLPYLLAEVALGLAAYAVVAFLHVRRIKKVPLSLALKVQE